jgi:hypothetical protein
MSSCDLDPATPNIEAHRQTTLKGGEMTKMLLPIACAVALAAAAPAAFAKGGDDGPGDDHGQDASALVQKGHDDPPGDDHGAAAEPGDDKGQDAPAATAPSRSAQKKQAKARKRAKIGACTIRSTSKLKANAPRNGRIQVEFEVESHVSGQTWTVVLKDNGATFFSGSKTTQAPGGSFEAKASAKDQAGVDSIAASATNPATGETCTASVSV